MDEFCGVSSLEDPAFPLTYVRNDLLFAMHNMITDLLCTRPISHNISLIKRFLETTQELSAVSGKSQ